VNTASPVVNWGDPRLPEVFWSSVSPCPVSGCWHWTGYALEGRPIFKNKSACRAVFSLIHNLDFGRSSDASRKLNYARAVSTCSTDGCCNPAHMRLAHERASYARESRKRYYIKNREIIKQKAKHGKRRWLYGLTEAAFAQMLLDQNGCCAICSRTFDTSGPKLAKPCVDHCHATGRIRALLCTRCNSTVGFADDNVETLRSAIAYLERHKVTP
jgi:hypothetical protein